ncbi:MAG: DUF177 domain-containing protein [Oscillospiraceae bacterium]|nr:DUF177 domain-containing protein [Oscillospiraceae bacterium]
MQKNSEAADYRISIRSLLLRPSEKKEINVTIDDETARSYGLPCKELPKAEGLFENRAGVLMMTYTLRCVPELVCDRCLSDVNTEITETFSHVIVTETASADNDAEYLLAPDAMLDLGEVVMEDLRLSLPTKILCKPDCKGLCPVCGKNRNTDACTCVPGEQAITVEFA